MPENVKMEEIFKQLNNNAQDVLLLVAKGMQLSQNLEKGEK